jgi:hypothetical protein
MTETNKLFWCEGKRTRVAEHIPCYEAEVSGGRYRIAPVVYHSDPLGNRYPGMSRKIGYEALFIPTEAKSAADLFNLAENLPSMEEAKAMVDRHHATCS